MKNFSKIILLIVTISMNAQQYQWAVLKNHGMQHQDKGVSIGVDQYGNSYVLGQTHEFLSGNSALGHSYFYKADQNGNIVFTYSLNYTPFKSVTDITQTPMF
jgi:hypothetical protein